MLLFSARLSTPHPWLHSRLPPSLFISTLAQASPTFSVRRAQRPSMAQAHRHVDVGELHVWHVRRAGVAVRGARELVVELVESSVRHVLQRLGASPQKHRTARTDCRPRQTPSPSLAVLWQSQTRRVWGWKVGRTDEYDNLRTSAWMVSPALDRAGRRRKQP